MQRKRSQAPNLASIVSVSRYVLGVIALVIVVGSLGFAAVALRRRCLPAWRGAPARLAEAVIILALLIIMLQVLGAVGLFRLGPIAAASALIAWGAWAVGGRRSADARAAGVSGSAPLNRAATAIALLAAAAVTAQWASPTLSSYDFGIRGFDSLWYHLPWAASFAQTGHITPLRFTDVEYLTPFYPATAEMLHGLGIVLLGRDTLSPAGSIGWLGLTLLAAWCIGRPRERAPATLLGAALALATPMMDFSQAGSAANDIVGVFFLLAAVALVLRAEDEPAALALGAIAAGLAVGVKLSLLAPVLALTIGTLAIQPAGRRRAAAALWLGALVVTGGFWYLRNLITVGNPLPWASFGILPTPHPPLQQHTGFSVAHYLTNTHVWNTVFEPGLASGLGPWWAVILAAALLGPLLCLSPRAGRSVRMLGLVALASIAAYLLTPESAAGPAGDPLGFAFNLRYAAPALTLSLIVLPLAPVLDGSRRQLATVLALAAVMVATLAQGRFWPGRHTPAAIGFVAALLVGLLLIEALRRLQPARLIAVAGVGMAALALAVAGYAWQRHYLRGRYVSSPGVSYMARAWALFRKVHGARVGVVGTFGGFFTYPLYGPDGSNRVQYIAQRGPHGSFTSITSCPAWRAAVNAGHYRYLVTTPARDPWHPKQLSRSPEREWTASDPAAHVIYTRRAKGQPITVFELDGPLQPATCS